MSPTLVAVSTDPQTAAMERELFAPGDLVVWDRESHTNLMEELHLRSYGCGPFRVREVIPVPVDEPACHHHDGEYHSPACLPDESWQPLLVAVGHRQWLVIEGYPEIRFSGQWFAKF
ncbi:hypothetical protein HGA91_00235 [candidate division WWE3 bacterium]|nr:hypothetical protein [candidate division WWE3 bacterium]